MLSLSVLCTEIRGLLERVDRVGGDTGIRGAGVKGVGNGDKGGGERGKRGRGTEILGAGVIRKFVVFY